MEQNMSNVFYYLKGPCSNLALKLEGARCCDFDTGVYFFNPPDSIAEWEEITADDISRLVRTLQSSGVYDVVFVDLPGAVDSRSAAVFKAADRILLIQGCDLVASAKVKAFEAGMGILEKKYGLSLAEKVTTVLNRCHPDHGMFDAGTLLDRPFVKIEECAAARKALSVSALVEDTMFLSDINGLLESIFTGDAMWTALNDNAFPKGSLCGGECIA
jgi:septum formation inhibitor-activating ATPase MinD